MDIKNFKEKYEDYVIGLRREFHKFPEVSLKEYETCKRVTKELDKIGIEYKVVAETGI